MCYGLIFCKCYYLHPQGSIGFSPHGIHDYNTNYLLKGFSMTHETFACQRNVKSQTENCFCVSGSF